MFLDDTACNLASLNLLAFQNDDGTLDVDAFAHAVRLWTIVLEISVMMAQYPSRRIAQLSYEFRTLGLGFANIGGYLMAAGIPYDSDEARHLCGADQRADDRRRLRRLGGDGGRARRLPALRREPRGDAAGDPQPPPRRARREPSGYEGLSVPPVPLERGARPRRGAGRGGARTPGTGRWRWARRTASATRRSR